MQVRLVSHMTGTRDGVDWPERGSLMELPDSEAKDLIGAGIAEALDEDELAEVEDPENAVQPTRRGRSRAK